MENILFGSLKTSELWSGLKYLLHHMSWMEAQEACKRSDTAIVPVGTLHGHGPTPLGIDAISVERLAQEVAKRTGLLTLPVLPYGENEDQKRYPGTIAIRDEVIEELYMDICRSLRRNGIKKVIFLNGHGGNRKALMNTGFRVRELGMLIAIPEWYVISRMMMKDLFPGPRPGFFSELAVSMAILGTDVADLRSGGYKGEWGPTENTTLNVKKIYGEKIVPLGRGSISASGVNYKGAEITIPMDSWEVDLPSPPELDKNKLEELRKKGEEIIRRVTDYLVEFAKDFEKVDVSVFLKGSQA